MSRAHILRMTTTRILAVAALAIAAAGMGGCRDFGDVTGSIRASAAPSAGESDLRAYAETCRQRYEGNPGEKSASIDYARALRALTRYGEAAAVMQTAAVKSPTMSRSACSLLAGSDGLGLGVVLGQRVNPS